VRTIIAIFQLLVLSALVLFARCANYEQVFIAGNIYFTDADCYARMSRVQKCIEHPGLILRHHDFENYPTGTTPHTTAPLDYLIVGLAKLLGPFCHQPVDLAGALVSPLLGLVGMWFLWWWGRMMKLKFNGLGLILYAVSPILVHGTELGRPDHQSLLMLLILVAICAEWTLALKPSRGWGIVSGCSWALALWVSLYEPAILFGLIFVPALLVRQGRARLSLDFRRPGWICFVAVLALALLIERRIPSWTPLVSDQLVRNWMQGIGELHPVPIWSAAWFSWAGYLILFVPFVSLFLGKEWWNETEGALFELTLLVLLGITVAMTLSQARWAYFFLLVWVLVLPWMFQSCSRRALIWIAFLLSLWPVAQDWDSRFWPNEEESARLAEEGLERVNLRELALLMQSSEVEPILAPWWLSPSLSYWSKQPAVAGSSHESIPGIIDTARFYAALDPQNARAIAEKREVRFVVAYDSSRTAANCSQILGQTVGEHAVCYLLNRAPAESLGFLVFAAQNGAGKVFRIANNQ